jgi:hypothetical protein
MGGHLRRALLEKSAWRENDILGSTSCQSFGESGHAEVADLVAREIKADKVAKRTCA